MENCLSRFPTRLSVLFAVVGDGAMDERSEILGADVGQVLEELEQEDAERERVFGLLVEFLHDFVFAVG